MYSIIHGMEQGFHLSNLILRNNRLMIIDYEKENIFIRNILEMFGLLGVKIYTYDLYSEMGYLILTILPRLEILKNKITPTISPYIFLMINIHINKFQITP